MCLFVCLFDGLLGTLYKQAVCCCCQRWTNEGLPVDDNDTRPRRQSPANLHMHSTPLMTHHQRAADRDPVDPDRLQVPDVRATSVRISAFGSDVIMCSDLGGESL